MALLPDNNKTLDNTEQDQVGDKSSQKDEKKLSNLNDRELKALLDEAINYKNPKDREGKSELFNDLLLEAEESERIARATSAGGSELVRHCNQQARRQRHSGCPRGRRNGGPSSGLGRSVSERGTHGGSLDNLAKEELYETGRRLRGVRKSSTSSSGASSGFCGNQVRVSARQREGGSLPCNVNSGGTSRDFLFSKDDAKKSKEMKEKEYMDIEKERLIENDVLARGYEERLIDGGAQSVRASTAVETHIVTATPKYTSKATLQIQSNRVTAVDDPIALDIDNPPEKKLVDAQSLSNAVNKSKYQVIIPAYPVKTMAVDDKKMDENANALHQTKDLKKKKKQTDKNVVVLRSENIEGHKSEIIDNVDQLLHYIEGTTENRTRTVQSRSKQLQKQHTTDEGGAKVNRRKHKSKELGEHEVDVRLELKKSNSLGEISGIKLDRQFDAFGPSKNKREKEAENVVLRNKKSLADRARERRSWGTVEPHSIQTLYNASSLENLETTTDNWEVTRTKKKSKKRRNSTSGVRQTSSISGVSSLVNIEVHRARRAPSPNLGSGIVGMCNVKTTRSMPHSEKSNDSSSDVDSVHSLPLDGPISYADIAKNNEKKKSSPEKQDRPATFSNKENSPQPYKQPEMDLTVTTSMNINTSSTVVEKAPPLSINPNLSSKTVVPDVHNIKSFPAIAGVTKISPSATTDEMQNGTATSEKAVQSTNFEEAFVCEKTSTANQIVLTVPVASIESSKYIAVTQPVTTSPPVGVSSLAEPLVSNTGPSTGEKQQSGGKENIGKIIKELPNHTVQGFFGLQGDGQSDLSLMRDSTHYPSQRMPPDIMDVSTIEKMQFMNCSGSDSFPVTRNRNCQTASQVSCASAPSSLSIIAADSFNHQSGGKGKRKKANSMPKDSDTMNSSCDEVSMYAPFCDTSMDEMGIGSRIANGISDDTHYSSLKPHYLTNDVPLTEPPDSPPAVVILSGLPKDVPSGLVFGFDINEQLLLEDSGGCGNTPPHQLANSNIIVSGQTSSNNKIGDISIGLLASLGDLWAKRYRPPVNEGLAKDNHNRIVQFIAEAWEDVLNQKIQYYSNSL